MAAILVDLGAKRAHVEHALRVAAVSHEDLVTVISELGYWSIEQVMRARSRHLGLPYMPPSAVDAIDIERLAREGLLERADQSFVPVHWDGQRVLIAIASDKTGYLARNEYHPLRSAFVLASEGTIRTFYHRSCIDTASQVDALMRGGMCLSEDHGALWAAILRHACYTGASDVHIEAGPRACPILFRIDGVRQSFRVVHPSTQERLLNVLKTENRINTDPRVPHEATLDSPPADLRAHYDFRLQVNPTIQGLTARIRILPRDKEGSDFDSLNFDAQAAAMLRGYASKPSGLILLSGPTGAGKTTTLHGVMSLIDPLERSIQTIENPPEYKHAGWAQHEVRKEPKGEGGLRLSEGEEMDLWLRGLMRGDPDVIHVGEIRDGGTAATALRAAATGHLVFSTVHTDYAWLVPARLRELGVDMPLFAAKVTGIVNQRLVRRLCVHCRQVDERGETMAAIQAVFRQVMGTVYRAGEGCRACAHTGYRGRIVIYEMLEITPQVRELMADGAPPWRLRDTMVDARRLWGCAMARVAAGETSIEEVGRVVERG